MDKELVESRVDPSPFGQFRRWFDDACGADLPLPNAFSLATVTADGRPVARTMLLKDFDENGFVFFTNYESRKGRELDRESRVSLLFHWPQLERQVRIEGAVVRTSREESEAYFHSRPRESQVGAWASLQSSPLRDRAELEARFAEADETYRDAEIPLPPYWGGYCVAPDRMEFWQGRAHRLHDRLEYTRQDDGWAVVRLSP